jgi:tetratricopeptide (TPR) repeat protein
VFRTLSRSGLFQGDDAVRSLLGSMLPELAERAPLLPNDIAEARFRLFDAMFAVLEGVARLRPLAVVLDDLHSADPSSLAFLLFLARQLGGAAIYVIGTYRDQEARHAADGGALLALVAREGTYLPLARFGGAEVRAFADQMMGSGAPGHLLDAVFATTEGHPLFVDEVVRSLAQRAGPESLNRLQVPETVRDAIRARLLKLDPATRDALACAAVLGREVDTELLAAMRDQDDAQSLASALRTALSAGVLVALENDTYAFSHALVREALYFELPPDQRRKLHARAARCIERAGAADAARAEIVSHLLDAGSEVPVSDVATGAKSAASRAMRTYAFEDAALLLDRALPVLELRGAAPCEIAEVLVLLGEARARLRQDATAPCRRAAEIAKSIGDSDLLARAALALGAEIVPAVVSGALVDLLQTALAHLPPGKSILRARLLARLAGALQPAADPREPMNLAREAIAMARETGEKSALSSVLIGAGSALVDYALPAERLEIDRETLRLAEDEGDLPSAFRAHVRLFMDRLELGQVRQADQAIALAERLTRELRRPKFAWYVASMRAARALQMGRFDLAESFEAKAAEIAARAPDNELGGIDALSTCASAILRGDDGRIRACFERFAEYSIGFACDLGLEDIVSAFVRARLGQHDGLAACVARLPRGGINSADPVAMYLLSEVHFLGRIAEGAPVLLANLEARRDLFLTWGAAGLVPFGPVNWLLARLESLVEKWPEAERDFDDAIARCTEIGARPALAQVLLDYGTALARRGDAAARAEELLVRAADLATELGLPGMAARARAIRRPEAQGVEARAASPRGSHPAAELARAPRFTVARDGEVWLVSRAERSFRVKDTRGMSMLAELVAEPGRAKHVLLLGGRDPGDLGDAGPALDARAVSAYRDRLDDLRNAEREADASSDPARAERARAEIEAIARELAGALGLGGRNRRVASAVERARSNVQRRIKDAIRRIEEQDKDLGRYLTWTVRTGTFCVFDPKNDATE